MNTREIQERAFRLHKIVRAWNLHMQTNDYDAWEANFNVKQTFPSFLGNSRLQRTDENNAIRSVMYLNGKDFDPDRYKELVVVGCPVPVRNFAAVVAPALDEYQAWLKREAPDDLEGVDFEIWGGIPGIMNDIREHRRTPLQIAEILTKGKGWQTLWEMREHSNFLFDVHWPQIHKYKPLFKE